MAKTISDTVRFDYGMPEEIFNLYMDSQKQSEISGYEFKIGKNAGDRFTALNGMITGQNLKIVPGRMIVQSWRSLMWKRDVLDAVITIIFSEHENGTKVDVINANLPDNEQPFVKKETLVDIWKANVKCEKVTAQ